MDKQKLFNDIMEFINRLDGIAIFDKDGKCSFVSEGWTEATGYAIDDLENLAIWDVFPDSHAKIAMQTGKTIIGHPVVYGKDGKAGFTNYYPRFAPDGTVCGCYSLVMITGMDNALVIQNQIAELYSKIEYYEQELKRTNGTQYSLDNIIGNSPSIVDLKSRIKKIAQSHSTVLIEGETGTGKELVAHAIHQLSKRNTEHFVRVNCAAIPQELTESEFFGYTKGSFTGASTKGKIGKFQFADKGSLFLDEINSLPLTIQPKFLRALQEHEIEPIGSTENISVDVRIIAATNAPLETLVSEGKFRKDLYYRLNVVRVTVPPLRERKEDIPDLVDALVQRLNQSLGMYAQSVSDSALRLLMDYDWPGNIRELQNVIESAMNIAESSILRKRDFIELTRRTKTKAYSHLMLENQYQMQASKVAFEKELILEVLISCKNNRAEAARILGISRTMLYKKINQYEIKDF